MEFKAKYFFSGSAWRKHINRITVEFKAESRLSVIPFSSILIESQWNLKLSAVLECATEELILIESQWNLKARVDVIFFCFFRY